jgi:serine/threonine protein kinase
LKLLNIKLQNVVKLYGICLEPNKPLGLVTEYLELGSLKQLLKSRKLSYLEIVEVARDVARGIRVCLFLFLLIF